MAVKVLIDTSNKNNLSPEQLERQHKSKVRRLYDIANVFISVGLIEKVSGNLILKKPVFKYIGPIKIRNTVKINVLTPSPLSSINSVIDSEERTPYNCIFVGRSKRKLQFTVSEDTNEVVSPPYTPSQKWDEILQVADMELSKINNGI